MIVFTLGSLALIWISRKSLFKPRVHGFFRFWAWEAILGLIVLNAPAWFREPFSIRQMISWLFLLAGLFLVVESVRLLRRLGKQDRSRQDVNLVGLEKTSTLVRSGLYKYIRHPMYSSLLFLAWGVFLKKPAWPGGVLALAASVLLVLTAKTEEAEDVLYFGQPYQDYRRQTKMFLPFIF
jgi:protein-S-isoprenylcysteine O-methyltransferase Ste14